MKGLSDRLLICRLNAIAIIITKSSFTAATVTSIDLMLYLHSIWPLASDICKDEQVSLEPNSLHWFGSYTPHVCRGIDVLATDQVHAVRPMILAKHAIRPMISVRVCVTGQEGSSAVALVRASIPDRWRSAESNSTQPVCDASSLNFTAVCEADAGFDAIPESPPQVL